MRIIVDSENYFVAGSLAEYVECEYGTCQEYTGAIPNGFSSYEDWFVNCNWKSAYKLVNGDLVLDTDKEAELKIKIEQETTDNAPLLYKDLYGTNEVLNSQYQKATATGKILALNNVKNVAPIVKLTNINCYAFDKINLIATGKNLLPNEARTTTIDGMRFTINTDGSILINGTATADIEYNIAGTSTNTSPFLAFKKGFNYYLSCGYTIKMYNYDGIDRTQIYSDTGGLINFVNEDKKITQAVLNIPSGTTINNVTIYPMLNLGTTAESYEKAKTKTFEIDFSDVIEEGLLPSDDLFPSDTLFPKGTTIDYIHIENGLAYISVNGTISYVTKGNLNLLDGYNNVYTMQDTNIEMTYCINKLDGYSTTTEMNSAIKKSADEIKLEVNATIDGVEKGINAQLELKVDTDNLVSEINASADQITLKGNRFVVEADNFSLDKYGNMESKSGEIGGWTINSEGFTNGTVIIKNNGSSTIYTFVDMLVIRNYMLGNDMFNLAGNTKLFNHYDINGDGVIDGLDYVRITKMLGFEEN